MCYLIWFIHTLRIPVVRWIVSTYQECQWTALFLQFVEDDAKNKLSSGNLTYLAANLKSAFYNRIYIYISTFITDLPACHLQFATLNFEPLNQESGLLDLDHLCFRGQVWQSKSDPINLPGRCVFKKKTNEKHRRPWSRYHPAIFGRSAHQIIWTKQTFPNDGLPSWPFQ